MKPSHHKDPGLFVSEEGLLAPPPLTEELIDEEGLEEDENEELISPVTPLEDPREA